MHGITDYGGDGSDNVGSGDSGGSGAGCGGGGGDAVVINGDGGGSGEDAHGGCWYSSCEAYFSYYSSSVFLLLPL